MKNKGTSLLEDFDFSAQNWGWQKDQGYGAAVDSAFIDYQRSRKDLERYIQKLQHRIKRLTLEK